MLILGLGSNIGDRLAYLRMTLKKIAEIPGLQIKQVSPIYLSDALLTDNAPKTWDHPFLNLALGCTTTLTPDELIVHTKAIEKQMGEHAHWAPRVIDIDILAWDDLVRYDEKLHIPHEALMDRPFALWPLADISPSWAWPVAGLHFGKTAFELASIWGSRFSGDAPLHTRQIQQRIDTPCLMGIVNLTPNSFSDGNRFNSIDAACAHAAELVRAGAEIIDLGAEATGPKSQPISATEEWGRLEPVLTAVLQQRKDFIIPPKISVDTYHWQVAEKALNLGVDWINDVTALDDPKMREVVSESNCSIVFMHHLGVPVNSQKTVPITCDPVAEVLAWADLKINELMTSGIAKERLIFDPGIGYGKTAFQSVQLVKHCDVFKSLNIPILIGHSRKSLLTLFTDRPASLRDIETLSMSLFLASKQVDYLRLHDVASTARALKVAGALYPLCKRG